MPARQMLPDRERIYGRLLHEAHPIRVRRAHRALLSLRHSTEVPRRRSASPVIVVGMHRSGTSLTARILDRLGVDMGPDATRAHHESLSFMMRNRLLLTATKAEWDQPQPLLDALEDPDWSRALALLLEQTVIAPRSWLVGLHEPPPGTGDRPWGWKDPRTSLTWPLWLELYPNARFVLVQRNRSDVIASLLARSRENLRLETDLSIRTLTEGGVDSLCSDYQAALGPLASTIDEHRIFDIRYEDLLSDPTKQISALAAWLGRARADVASAVGLVRPAAPTGNRAEGNLAGGFGPGRAGTLGSP